MVHLVGLDSGCAGTKLVHSLNSDTIQETVIPSLAKRGAASVSLDGKSGITYQCDGEQWSISPGAFGCEDTRFDSYPFSTLNAVLSIHALIEQGFSGERVKVASGLPLNQYYSVNDEGRPNKAMIERKHRQYDLTVKRRTPRGFEAVNITLESVRVCPESVAAWADYCLDDDGGLVFETMRPVGLIDIGGRTTDIAVISGGQAFQIEPEYTGTLAVGYLDIFQKVNAYINQQGFYDGVLETAVLDQAVRTGTIELFNEPVDISEGVRDAKAVVVREIQREVERRFAKVKGMAGQCYFGGGAEDLRETLTGDRIIIPKRAQFSNARGYRKIARLGGY